MKRYEPRDSKDGWLVFDSLTDETLTTLPDPNSFGAASALSMLLNDLESIGRAPRADEVRSSC